MRQSMVVGKGSHQQQAQYGRVPQHSRMSSGAAVDDHEQQQQHAHHQGSSSFRSSKATTDQYLENKEGQCHQPQRHKHHSHQNQRHHRRNHSSQHSMNETYRRGGKEKQQDYHHYPRHHHYSISSPSRRRRSDQQQDGSYDNKSSLERSESRSLDFNNQRLSHRYIDYRQHSAARKDQSTDESYMPATTSRINTSDQQTMHPKLWKKMTTGKDSLSARRGSQNHTTADAVPIGKATTATMMPDPAEISATESSFSQSSPLVMPPNHHHHHHTTTSSCSVSSVCSSSVVLPPSSAATTTTTTTTHTVPKHIRAVPEEPLLENGPSLTREEEDTRTTATCSNSNNKQLGGQSRSAESTARSYSVAQHEKKNDNEEPAVTSPKSVSNGNRSFEDAWDGSAENETNVDKLDKTKSLSATIEKLDDKSTTNNDDEDDGDQDDQSLSDGSTPRGKSKEEYIGYPKGHIDLVTIGTRVAVFWDEDDCYYEAIVRKERPNKKKRFLLRYDDGDKEWINFKKVPFYILSGGVEENDFENYSIGLDDSKVQNEPTKKNPTITTTMPKRSEHHIAEDHEAAQETSQPPSKERSNTSKTTKTDVEVNDDDDDSVFGDNDDSAPKGKSKEDYGGLPPGRIDLVEIGTQVAVYWDQDQCYYEAVITKERPEKKKRFLLRYDDGDKEWINFKKVPFFILSGGIETDGRDAVADIHTDDAVQKDESQTDGGETGPRDLGERGGMALPKGTVAKEEDRPQDKQEVEPPHGNNAANASDQEQHSNSDDKHDPSSEIDEPKSNGKSREDYSGLSEGHIDMIRVGARVAVYWNGDSCYYEAVVKKERPNKKKRFLLRYDDGDKEWINFNKVQFFVLEGANERFNHHDWVNDDDWVTGAASMESSDSEGEQDKVGVHSENSMTASDAASTELIGDANAKVLKAAEDASKPDSRQQDVATSRPKKHLLSPALNPDDTPDDEALMWQELYEKFGDVRSSSRTRAGSVSEPSFDAAAGPAPIPPPKKRRVEAAYSQPSTPERFSHSPEGSSERKRKNPESTLSPKKKRKGLKLKLKVRKEESSSEVARSQARPRPPCSGIDDDLDAAEAASSPSDEATRKKEESRTPTAAEIAAILGEDCDDGPCAEAQNWVRRSARMPARSAVNSPKVQQLLQYLRTDHPDMVVLKMKKYVPDSATSQLVIDAVLDALEENTNCEALYIQNYNEGMRDEQVLRLLKIMQHPSCKIWCLNIGETYKVKHKTWKKFAKGLKKTNITHTYLSEHTITPELKEFIRDTIRVNRSKHNMHIDPNNLDTIVKCTHNWWNPFNAKVLQPYLHARGYAHILKDKKAQGAQGIDDSAKYI